LPIVWRAQNPTSKRSRGRTTRNIEKGGPGNLGSPKKTNGRNYEETKQCAMVWGIKKAWGITTPTNKKKTRICLVVRVWEEREGGGEK